MLHCVDVLALAKVLNPDRTPLTILDNGLTVKVRKVFQRSPVGHLHCADNISTVQVDSLLKKVYQGMEDVNRQFNVLPTSTNLQIAAKGVQGNLHPLLKQTDKLILGP